MLQKLRAHAFEFVIGEKPLLFSCSSLLTLNNPLLPPDMSGDPPSISPLVDTKWVSYDFIHCWNESHSPM